LIDEPDGTERFLVTSIDAFDVSTSIWTPTRVPRSYFREPWVCRKNGATHLLPVELVCVKVAL
jgi:hypothetical protein